MTAHRFAITSPTGTRCGVYPGPAPLDAMALDAGCASLAEWSASTGVDPATMRVERVPVEGELCLLPGDLLGRVTGRAVEHGLACVERWGGGAWHAFGVEREDRLRVEGVETHHHYGAAVAHAYEPTDTTTKEETRP